MKDNSEPTSLGSAGAPPADEGAPPSAPSAPAAPPSALILQLLGNDRAEALREQCKCTGANFEAALQESANCSSLALSAIRLIQACGSQPTEADVERLRVAHAPSRAVAGAPPETSPLSDETPEPEPAP